jgi:hypothetical protein
MHFAIKLTCWCSCVVACRLKPELEHIAVTSELLTNDGQIKWRHYPNYFLFGKGPLATTGCDRGAFVNTRGGCQLLSASCLILICGLLTPSARDIAATAWIAAAMLGLTRKCMCTPLIAPL